MNIHSLGALSQQYMQSLFGTGGANSSSTTNSSSTGQTDGQLSPFASILTGLQQMEQANPTQYAQLTSQISTKLQNAAQTAQTNGNTTLANQLTTLSKDFSSASTSGQLPNLQDLANAVPGGRRHFAMGSGNPAGGNAGLFQYLTQGGSSATLSPANIILNSMNGGSGITTSLTSAAS